MRYVSLFSGIEAASCAWESLGWEPVAFSEVDPFCCDVLSVHYPNVPNLGDIKKIDWSDIGTVDVVVGGSPCQSFSVAGRRAGLMDERGLLMYEYVRAMRDIRPLWCLWENVPGVLSQDKGRAFAALMWELEKLGYCLCWRVLDAQYFGVAQRRRRVFLVGHSRVGCAAAVLFERESLQRDTQENPRSRAQNTRNAGEGVKSTGFLTTSNLGFGIEQNPTLDTGKHSAICMTGDGSMASIDENLSGTLKSQGGYSTITTDTLVRRLTPLECERLQGFPDGWTNIEYKGKPTSDTQRYKALGNTMAVPVMFWLGNRMQQVSELAS